MIDTKEFAFLKDWMMRYIKNRDLITKHILSIDETSDGFVVKKKSGEQTFYIEPFLTDTKAIIDRMKAQKENRAVACFHTRQNFDILMKNWDDFVGIGRNFTLYFVNPFSKMDRVLILSPYTHQMIADESSLKAGLKTMSESVEFTTEEEIKKIIES